MALGSNPIINDGKISIIAENWLQPIADAYPALAKKYLELELTKKRTTKAKTEALTSVITNWQALWDEIGTFLAKN